MYKIKKWFGKSIFKINYDLALSIVLNFNFNIKILFMKS